MRKRFENPTSFWHQQRARKSADTRLKAKPNVIGTGFGAKLTGGKATGEKCFVVYVSRKVHLELLPKEDRIPPTVRRHGELLPTDVVEGWWLEDQSAMLTRHPAPHLGTSEIVALREHKVVCLCCAHSMTGPEIGDHTQENVVEGKFETVPIFTLGSRYETRKIPGSGMDHDYGRFDAGVICDLHADFLPYVQAAAPVQYYRPADPSVVYGDLYGKEVEGFGFYSGRASGVINEVFSTIGDEFVDVAIYDGTRQLTQPGDSGMCWRLMDGTIVAIHYAGIRQPRVNHTTGSAAMLVYRAFDYFGLVGIKLLVG